MDLGASKPRSWLLGKRMPANLEIGVYPASVTPLDEKGGIDFPAIARLLAWFEAAGCKGVVLAGTNGEGPSLTAPEKRDLIRESIPLSGKLKIIQGIATSSLEEAVWLCNQAHKDGAVAALVMPPGYFREASEEGIAAWFESLLERTQMPIVAYNFPQRTGVTLGADLLARLANRDSFAGVKDSSGAVENLAAYASALAESGRSLFVGNETLLVSALEAGWSGTISGAANVIPYPLTCVVRDFAGGRNQSAESKFEILLPAIEAIRQADQPAMHKAILNSIGVLPRPDVRLPLMPPNAATRNSLFELLTSTVGPLDKQLPRPVGVGLAEGP